MKKNLIFSFNLSLFENCLFCFWFTEQSAEELKFLERANQRIAQQSSRPLSQPPTTITNNATTNSSSSALNSPSPPPATNAKRSSAPTSRTGTDPSSSDFSDMIDNANEVQGPPDFLAVAMFDYNGQRQQHEISFKFGDIVALYTDQCRPNDDWWQGPLIFSQPLNLLFLLSSLSLSLLHYIHTAIKRK
jgi:hypothetical protein